MPRKDKKLIIPVILLVIWINFLFSLEVCEGPDTSWTRFYGTANDDWAYAVDQTPEGGYIIAGGALGTPTSEGDIYFIMTDEYGDTLKTEIFEGDKVYSLLINSEGDYILVGSKTNYGDTNDVYLFEVEGGTSGAVSWTKTYGGKERDIGYSVDRTQDGGYIVCGMYGSGLNQGDFYLIKTDDGGDSVWSKTFGNEYHDCGYSVRQTIDGGYIIAGSMQSQDSETDSGDVYIIKTDSLGDIVWTRVYGGGESDAGHSVRQTMDGGYIIAGYTASFSSFHDKDVYLIKLDTSGDTTWTCTYGDTLDDIGYSILQTSDGGYIICGATENTDSLEDPMDVYLLKTDSTGTMQWSKTFGGFGEDCGYSVCATTDGGYIIAGYTSSFGMGGYDAYLIKTKPTKLVSPDGGEQLIGGSTHDIKWWCEHPEAQFYRLLFSADGGASYIDTIADEIDIDSTSWTWTVPDIYIATCRVKIEVLDNTRSAISEDESNGDFTIVEPGVNEYEITDPGFINIEIFPNPFKELTDIKLSIGHGAECIELEIYDVTGREVKKFSRLMLNALQPTLISWDGRDSFGKQLPSGVYFMRFVVEDFKSTNKLLLIR